MGKEDGTKSIVKAQLGFGMGVQRWWRGGEEDCRGGGGGHGSGENKSFVK